MLNIFQLGQARHQALVRRLVTHLLGSVLSGGIDLEDSNIVRSVAESNYRNLSFKFVTNPRILD